MSKIRKIKSKHYLILIPLLLAFYLIFNGISLDETSEEVLKEKIAELKEQQKTNNESGHTEPVEAQLTNHESGHAELVETQTYPEFKTWVKEKKQTLDIDSAKIFLNQIYQEYIPHYWNGTDWDFNGTTQTPKEGNIACGYFVTNTLDDIGFPVRRIYHAQQPSSRMINDLCVNVKRFDSVEKVKNHILENYNSDQVFIVGLDFHTGFLLKKGNEIYFLNSNYITDMVEKEVMEESANFNSSNSFMLGSLTENKTQLNHWIKS